MLTEELRGVRTGCCVFSLLGPLDFRFVSRLDQDGSLWFLFFQRRDLVLPTLSTQIDACEVPGSDTEGSGASHNLSCLGRLLSRTHGPETALGFISFGVKLHQCHTGQSHIVVSHMICRRDLGLRWSSVHAVGGIALNRPVSLT